MSVDFIPTRMIAESTYDIDPVTNVYYKLGMGDGIQDWAATKNTLTVAINCYNDWAVSHAVNASMVTAYVTGFTATALDFNAPSVASRSPINIAGATVATPWAPGASADPGIAGTTTAGFSWTFDILKAAGLGAAGDTTVNLRVQYRLIDAVHTAASWYNATFSVQIYLSSIFANHAGGINRVHTLSDAAMENVIVAGVEANDNFEAGDMFADTAFNLHNYDSAVNIGNIYAKVTPTGTTSGITLSNNKDTCWLPGTIAFGGGDVAHYRTDVAVHRIPGRVPGTAAINYTRTDSPNLRITESNLAINWPVGFNFANKDPGNGFNYSANQCHVTDVTLVTEGNATRAMYPDVNITQPTFTDEVRKFNVTITNDGNT
jgi:hypothetical protein